jgi:hypothetical protein
MFSVIKIKPPLAMHNSDSVDPESEIEEVNSDVTGKLYEKTRILNIL